MTDAMAYLDRVAGRAKELYALSDQGPWDALHPSLQAMWINAADDELRPSVGKGDVSKEQA